MSATEENAIRYASGYVPFKLLQKLKKRRTNKAAAFVECLTNMAVGGDVSSYYQYTTVWLHSKDKGGLFQINDATFLFFRAVEIGTQRHLPTHIRSASKSNSKETLIRSIMEGEDVLFLWDMLAVDIRDQDHSSELLELLIELWITTRGFSLASSWLEEYKQANKKGKGTKKSKALRKELKGPVQGDIIDD